MGKSNWYKTEEEKVQGTWTEPEEDRGRRKTFIKPKLQYQDPAAVLFVDR